MLVTYHNVSITISQCAAWELSALILKQAANVFCYILIEFEFTFKLQHGKSLQLTVWIATYRQSCQSSVFFDILQSSEKHFFLIIIWEEYLIRYIQIKKVQHLIQLFICQQYWVLHWCWCWFCFWHWLDFWFYFSLLDLLFVFDWLIWCAEFIKLIQQSWLS